MTSFAPVLITNAVGISNDHDIVERTKFLAVWATAIYMYDIACKCKNIYVAIYLHRWIF